MKKCCLLLFIMYFPIINVSAQIKMADETIKESLTAGNFIKEPISIENSFEEYDGTFLMNHEEVYYSKNIVGDTLFTNGCKSGISVNHEEKQVLGFRGDPASIPQGYYVVTSILYKEDFTKEMLSLSEAGYKIPIWGKDLESKFRDYCGGYDTKRIKIELEEARIKNKKCSLLDEGDCIVKLEGVNSTLTYYLRNTRYGDNLKEFVPVRYYNFLCKEFKGKDVFLTYDVYYNANVRAEKKRFEDAITGETIFQKDTLFRCTDVVANNKGELCCVLEGKETGRFAIKVTGHKEQYGGDCFNSFFYTGNPRKMSIWHTGQKESGRLAWIKYYYVKKDVYDTYSQKFLIKVDDLNKIFADTKRINALNAAQKKQAIARLKNNTAPAKRKQDLILLYGDKFGTLIAERKVALGMTPEMCKASWGTPLYVSNMVDASGKYTLWGYNLTTFIYFRNGKVERIEN